jgi:hypothetical protein
VVVVSSRIMLTVDYMQSEPRKRPVMIFCVNELFSFSRNRLFMHGKD